MGISGLSCPAAALALLLGETHSAGQTSDSIDLSFLPVFLIPWLCAATLLRFSFDLSLSFVGSFGNPFSQAFPQDSALRLLFSSLWIHAPDALIHSSLVPFLPPILYSSDSKTELVNSNTFRAKPCTCGKEATVYECVFHSVSQTNY